MAQTFMQSSLTLYALFITLLVFVSLVNSAPQLQFDDNQEVSSDGVLVEPYALTRSKTNRRAAVAVAPPPNSQVLQGAFGHHQPAYHQPSYGHQQQSGYGTGHSQGHGHGHGGPVGPVFTFVRTDYHGNFQTGVRHRVSTGYGHGR